MYREFVKDRQDKYNKNHLSNIKIRMEVNKS